jgi:hypothetical protein
MPFPQIVDLWVVVLVLTMCSAGLAVSHQTTSGLDTFQQTTQNHHSPIIVAQSATLPPPLETGVRGTPQRQYRGTSGFAQTVEVMRANLMDLARVLQDVYLLRSSAGDTLRIESIAAGSTVVMWSLNTSRIMLTKMVLNQRFLDAAGNESSPLAAFAPIPASYNLIEQSPLGSSSPFPTLAPNAVLPTSLDLSAPTNTDEASHSPADQTSAPGDNLNSSDSSSTNRAILIVAALLCASGVLLCSAFLIYQCRRHCCKETPAASGGGPRVPHVTAGSQCSELEVSNPEKNRSIEIWRTETLGATAETNGKLTPIPQSMHDLDA